MPQLRGYLADERWIRARVEALREVLDRHRLPTINAKSKAERRKKLLRLMEDGAPRRALQEMVEQFRTREEQGGSLSEWADIIHPKETGSGAED